MVGAPPLLSKLERTGTCGSRRDTHLPLDTHVRRRVQLLMLVVLLLFIAALRGRGGRTGR